MRLLLIWGLNMVVENGLWGSDPQEGHKMIIINACYSC